jgi:hypothetical protein
MLYHLALVRSDISEECITYIIRVTGIAELGTMLAVTSSQSMLQSNTLMLEAIRVSEMSVLIRATRCNVPDDGILHSHRRGNLRSYIVYLLILEHIVYLLILELKRGKINVAHQVEYETFISFVALRLVPHGLHS